MTRIVVASGFNEDHIRTQLGRGNDIFGRAMQAIREWRMFAFPWVKLTPPTPPIEAGSIVAVCVKHFGFYSLNACPIAYTIRSSEIENKFGFAYGTLSDHAENGEERFMVEVDVSGAVWFDILAYSRPNLAARMAYPLTRRLQKRFARESLAAMIDAVNQE